MTNAARYSQADSISVSLREEGGLVRLVVEDDGVGFDPALVDKSEHFGLQLIIERVEAVEGAVMVESALGRGTRVVAVLPSEVT